MALLKQDLDAIGQACKEIIEEELDPIKERLDALEAGVAGKSDGDTEALEAQMTELRTALDETLGASKSLVDEDGEPVTTNPSRDAWGRKIKKS